jgi:TP901 family phage tail tape measure protein
LSEIAKLYVSIGAKTRDFESGMRNVQRSMRNIGKNMTRYVTLPLAGVGVAALKMSMDFEKALANVDTLLGGNAARIEEFKRGIQDMAIATGKSTGDLTDGMYQVVSAFGDTEHSLYLLETAARAGAAGLSSTKASINLLSGVIKGYNMDVTKAAEISDYAFATVRLGQTTFDELAASMGTVVPIASTLDVSMEELWGTMATLTGVTGTTSEVSTQFRGILVALIRPTKEMSGAISALGYESGRAMLETLGLEGTLHALKGAAGGSDETLAKMFGRVEALNAVLALTGAQADTWNMKMGEMENVAGETAAAFEIQAQTMAFRWEQLKQAGVVLLQELGDVIRETVVPLMEALLPVVQNLIEGFRAMPDSMKQIIVVAGAILAALAPVLMFVSAILPALKLVAAVFAALSIAVVAKAAVIVAAIMGIIAIIRYVWRESELFRDVVVAIWEYIKINISTAVTVLAETIKAILAVLQGDWSKAWQHMSNAGRAILEGFRSIAQIIMRNIANHVLGYIKRIVDGIGAFARYLPGEFAATVAAGAARASSAISGVMANIDAEQRRQSFAASARGADVARGFRELEAGTTGTAGAAIEEMMDDLGAAVGAPTATTGGGGGGSSGGGGGGSLTEAGNLLKEAAEMLKEVAEMFLPEKTMHEKLLEDIERVEARRGDEDFEAYMEKEWGGLDAYLESQQRRLDDLPAGESGGSFVAGQGRIHHSFDPIVIKGVDNEGQLVGTVRMIMPQFARAIKDGNRRYAARTSLSPLSR